MPSYKAAIEQKCRECIHDPRQQGTWRQQVAACTATACPLYPVRAVPIRSRGATTVPCRRRSEEVLHG